MVTYSIKHLSVQSVELFGAFLCLNWGVYDTISPKGFIDIFFQFKVIDNFNISKINVKFEHQFKAPFRNIYISYLYARFHY